MSAHLDSTYGTMFIAMVVAAVLYGISCVQALYYYTNQSDPWYIKLVVTAVILLDTVHQALITHTVYTYTVTGWGSPGQLLVIVRTVQIATIFTGITGFIVQGFLTMRIWRMSERNIYLTGISAALTTGGFVTIIIYVSMSLPLHLVSEAPAKMKNISIVVNAFSAITDIIIAVTLCALLNTSRTGNYKSEIIINRLIMFTVNTGLLTSFCALGSLITVFVATNTFVCIAFFFCLGRLYTNTLLATLNARKIIRNVDTHSGTVTDVSFPLQNFHISGSGQIYQPGNEKKLDGNPRLPYDDGSIRT